MWMWCLPLMFFACDSVCYIYSFLFQFRPLCPVEREKQRNSPPTAVLFSRLRVCIVPERFQPAVSSSYQVYGSHLISVQAKILSAQLIFRMVFANTAQWSLSQVEHAQLM
jgi:hypothetical protein